MVTISRPDATFFSFPQIRAMLTWSAAQPSGCGVRIMTDYEYCPEMAEVFRRGNRSPVWFLNATQAGTIVMTEASGADEEWSTVEAALARILELER